MLSFFRRLFGNFRLSPRSTNVAMVSAGPVDWHEALAADVVAFALAKVGDVTYDGTLAAFDGALEAVVDLAGGAGMALDLEAALVTAVSADLERVFGAADVFAFPVSLALVLGTVVDDAFPVDFALALDGGGDTAKPPVYTDCALAFSSAAPKGGIV